MLLLLNENIRAVLFSQVISVPNKGGEAQFFTTLTVINR